MAGLADIDIPTRTITVGTGAVVLRGLSFEEIGALMLEHAGAFEGLERAFRENVGGDGLAALINLAPRLIAHAVAMAADEPDQTDKVRRLGAGFLQEAALAVWELTTEPAGGGKKFISRLTQLFSAARENLPATLKSPEQAAVSH